MTAITKAGPDATAIEAVLIKGDLSQLTESQRLAHYQNVCASLKLNPLTQPFDYIKLSGKLVLYAKRDAAEQLRKLHGVSIVDLTTERFDEVYVVTVKAQDKTGRTDMSTGAVPLGKLYGEALANQLMKCETKAKRRVTLSICGLGMLDETEVETIRKEAPPLIVEATPERPPAPEGFVYLERIDAKTTKGGRAYADVTLSTGEIVMAFGEMVKLLEQLAQDQVAVQIETEKTPKGYTHIIEARTAAGMMKPEATPPENEIPF